MILAPQLNKRSVEYFDFFAYILVTVHNSSKCEFGTLPKWRVIRIMHLFQITNLMSKVKVRRCH